MERIPDEITFRILAWLPWKERIICEMVCWNWRTLVLHLWSQVRSCALQGVLYDEEGCSCHRERKLHYVLSRCGPMLRSLKLAAVANCRSVQSFTAKYELTTTAIHHIGQLCSNLARLDLSHHFFENEMTLKELLVLPQTLEELLLENCRLDTLCDENRVSARGLPPIDEILVQLFECLPKLRKISLRYSCNGFFTVTQLALAYAPATLSCMDLSGSYSARIADLEFLQRLPFIEELHLERTEISTDQLSFLEAHRHTLRKLSLSYAKHVRDFMPLATLEHLHHLQLDGNRDNLLDDAVVAICLNCQALRYLSLENCTALSERSVRNIFRLTRLEYLSVNSVHAWTDSCLQAVCMYCPQLETLQVKYCRRLTAASLSSLALLKRLQHLGVSGVKDFGPATLRAILQDTKLTFLEAMHCPKLTSVNKQEFPHQLTMFC